MIANIKNGHLSKKSFVLQKRKNICEKVLNVLWDEGFILGYSIIDEKSIKIYLKYTNDGQPVINSIKSISKPGHKLYYSAKQIWKIDTNKNFKIFSTNKGIKSIIECKKNKIGGEPLILIN